MHLSCPRLSCTSEADMKNTNEGYFKGFCRTFSDF